MELLYGLPRGMLGVWTIAHMHFLSVVAVAIASGRVQLSSLVLVQSVHSYVRAGQVISRQYTLVQPWYTMNYDTRIPKVQGT